MENKEKNKKDVWWYRLAKVIYVLLYIIVLVIAIGIIVDNHKPSTTKIVDRDNSYVACFKGDNELTRFNFSDNPEMSAFPNSLELYYSVEEDVKQQCASLGANNYYPNIVTKEETDGSWLGVIWRSFITLLGIYIFMYMLASAFKYIVFGEGFQKPFITEVIEELDD